MNYLTYKIIIGDDPGAPYFNKIAPWLDSAKALDDTYNGPDFYWNFYQFGDFDDIDITLIKWEVWSTWRLKKPDDFNKGAFIGVNCGLFIYNPEDPKSFETMKTSLELYMARRQSRVAPIIIIALFDEAKYDMMTFLEADFMKEQNSYINEKKGKILAYPNTFLDGDIRDLITFIYRDYIESLQANLSETLDINNSFWFLTLPELQAILLADRKGIQLRPRHAPPLPPPEPVVEPTEGDTDEIVDSESDKEPEMESRKLTMDDLTDEERKQVAISPEGEIIILKEDITQAEITDLVKKGYKLPAWVVIPRHCPKCYNQKQGAIREIVDKSIVLMQNPRIYGFKYVCGKCGNEWHPSK
jgi:hypothetical protein